VDPQRRGRAAFVLLDLIHFRRHGAGVHLGKRRQRNDRRGRARRGLPRRCCVARHFGRRWQGRGSRHWGWLRPASRHVRPRCTTRERYCHSCRKSDRSDQGTDGPPENRAPRQRTSLPRNTRNTVHLAGVARVPIWTGHDGSKGVIVVIGGLRLVHDADGDDPDGPDNLVRIGGRMSHGVRPRVQAMRHRGVSRRPRRQPATDRHT
jgi:hypothetical protein